MLNYEKFVAVLSLGAVVVLTTGVNRCQTSYDFAAQSTAVTPTGTSSVVTVTPTGTITVTITTAPNGTTTPGATTTGAQTGIASPTPTETDDPDVDPDVDPAFSGSNADFQISKKQASGAALLGALSQLENEEKSATTEAPSQAIAQNQKDATSDQNWLGKGFGKKSSNQDSDGDSFSDFTEEQFGTDPNDANSFPPVKVTTELSARLIGLDDDADGLPNAQEKVLGTDPLNADSDGDGVSDGAEIRSGTDPLKLENAPVDSDGDGLSDQFEKSRGLDWLHADGDGDGLRDDTELAIGTDITNPDSDGDGIPDGKEVAIGSDPTIAE